MNASLVVMIKVFLKYTNDAEEKVPSPTKAANLEDMMKTFEETEKICEAA